MMSFFFVFYMWRPGRQFLDDWIACNYVKRKAERMNWGDKIEKKDNCCNEKYCREDDPMSGSSHVPKLEKGVIIKCDASSVSTDIVLEIGGVKTEDMEWLKKKKRRWLQSY